MSKRITIDPITRIEGHLRIDVEVEGGKVQQRLVLGPDVARASRPSSRAATRATPGCSPSASAASAPPCTPSPRCARSRTRSKLEIPLNAQLHPQHHHRRARACTITSSTSTTCRRSTGWTWSRRSRPTRPRPSALAETLSPWPGNCRREMEAVKDKLAGFVERGQLGIFTNGYWGHPAMKLPPEVNLLAVAHYLQALEYQRKANKVVAILGSQDPEHPEPGGRRRGQRHQPRQPGHAEHGEALHDQGPARRGHGLRRSRSTSSDVAAVGAMYPDWFGYGAGVTNYLAVPDLPTDTKGTQFDLPGGTIMDGDLAERQADHQLPGPVLPRQRHRVHRPRLVRRRLEQAPVGGGHRPEVQRVDRTTGSTPGSRRRASRGKPMQVGPLAQVLVGVRSPATS